MATADDRELAYLVEVLFQAHPWHGVHPGDRAPEVVRAYVEIVPTDAVKYELDKPSGHLRIDRPQRYSSICPTLYGFIPQTYCGDLTAKRCADKHGLEGIHGDGDPLDICVLSEKPFSHGAFLCDVRPVGGMRMIDGKEDDDKIIAVLENDLAYGSIRDIQDVPGGLLERLRHYFLSYKQMPDVPERKVEIADIYGRDEALEVIRCSFQDYRDTYGQPEHRLPALRRLLSRKP